jgi:hypothetical protein
MLNTSDSAKRLSPAGRCNVGASLENSSGLDSLQPCELFAAVVNKLTIEERGNMTRKSKLEAKQPTRKSKRLVIDVTDDEHFNWLHSRRTPEEKKRDAEIQRQQLEEEVRREWEELSKLSEASASRRTQ